jgi:hypothetical protein
MADISAINEGMTVQLENVQSIQPVNHASGTATATATGTEKVNIFNLNQLITYILCIKGTCCSSEHFLTKMNIWTWHFHHITGMPIWQYTTHLSFVPIKGAEVWTFQFSQNAPARTGSFREMDNWKVLGWITICSQHSGERNKV